jgi:hypothetical protein
MEASKRVAKSGTFKLLEAAINTWHHIAEHGTTIDDVLKPEFFVHHAREVKVWNEIKVVAADGSFYLHLLVEAVADTGIYTSVIFSRQGASHIEQPDETDFRVEFGGAHKWRIVRTTDGAVLNKGIPNKAEADRLMAEMLQKVSATPAKTE